MSKLSAEHLARGAYVYVRQSSADQLRHNHESRRRQYALVERARALGWSEVVVIDDDLGVSASGVARPGFERLLAAICRGVVGAVVSIEASRLARNGRDWHTLLEFCAVVDTLILDEDGVYDVPKWWSSTMTWVCPPPAWRVLDSSSSWRQFAAVWWVPWSRSKPHAWRATAATGIRCWNSALWSTPSSWTRMGCMTCATPAIGCSWA